MKIYSVEPCGLLFAENETLKSLNGEVFESKGRHLELIKEVKAFEPMTEEQLEQRVNSALWDRTYNLNTVKQEIIEKNLSKKKPKKKGKK